jgi:HEAT repeat protein
MNMKKRLLFWVPTLALAAATASVAVPASPFYLPDFLMRGGYHDGHPTRYWVNELKASDGESRSRAIHAVGAIGPDAAEAVPALAVILREDPEGMRRAQAALALTKMRPASRGAVPALAEALSDKDAWVRMNAVIALAGLGTDSRPAIPALIPALKDEANRTNLGAFSFTIQEEAAIALGRASAGTPDGVPALTETMRTTPSAALRRAAARALGLVGAEARTAVPALRAMQEDTDETVQWTAERALHRIEGEPQGTP